MDRSTIKGFIRWTEEATDEELAAKRERLKEAKAQITSPEGKADLRLAFRLLDEEVMARLELAHSYSYPQRKQA
jgi:hypothetical protein